MSKIINQFLCCSAVGAIMIGTPAIAQTGPDAAEDEQGSARSGGLEEIVVTATRIGETNLQETPIAITAFSSAALEKTNSADLQDVAQFVPGLSIGNRVGSGSNFGAIAIRGMGVDAQESSAAVGTYIDDVFYASGRGNIVGLVDVARLEVLRGPQGTLFGRNTIAGAIQYVTKAPSNEFEGYIGGTFGEYGRKDVNGALNLPIGDTLAVRFSGAYDSIDGYVRDEANNIDRGAVDTKIGRVRIKWEPSDRLSVNLKGEYVESSSNGRASLVSKVNPLSQFVGIANFIAQGTLPPITNALVSANFNPGDFSSAGFNADDHFDFESKSVSGVIAYDLSLRNRGSTAPLSSITTRRPSLSSK
jgi:iron complex outermembrane recepter protein